MVTRGGVFDGTTFVVSDGRGDVSPLMALDSADPAAFVLVEPTGTLYP